jgi:hypothetical protein
VDAQRRRYLRFVPADLDCRQHDHVIRFLPAWGAMRDSLSRVRLAWRLCGLVLVRLAGKLRTPKREAPNPLPLPKGHAPRVRAEGRFRIEDLGRRYAPRVWFTNSRRSSRGGQDLNCRYYRRGICGETLAPHQQAALVRLKEVEAAERIVDSELQLKRCGR